MKTAAIIQARMGSSRLPGKVLMDLGGKPVLQRVIERCQLSDVQNVIVATTTNLLDQPIVNFCKKMGVDYFKGSEENVFDRMYQAAKKFEIDLIVDITSDCPLVDPETISGLLLYDFETCAYASNITPRTFPDGFDVQIYRFNALESLYKYSYDQVITEHSGWNFTQIKDIEKMSIVAESDYAFPNWRLTLDTQKDLELLNWIYSAMGKEVWGHMQIIDFIKQNIIDFVSYDSMAEKACQRSIR